MNKILDTLEDKVTGKILLEDLYKNIPKDKYK